MIVHLEMGNRKYLFVFQISIHVVTLLFSNTFFIFLFPHINSIIKEVMDLVVEEEVELNLALAIFKAVSNFYNFWKNL